MSHLVSELNLFVEKILIVAPRRQDLVDLLERMCLELTTDLTRPEQKLRLANWAPRNPPVNSFVTWTSFTLGQRSGCDLRISLLGFALENGLPSENVFEVADAFIFADPHSSELSERFLKLKVPSAVQNKGVVFIEDDFAPSEANLRQKALQVWSQRNFPNSIILKDSPQTLHRSLDWILHL